MKQFSNLLFAILMCFTPAMAGSFKKTPAQPDAKITGAQARFAALQADRKKAVPSVIL